MGVLIQGPWTKTRAPGLPEVSVRYEGYITKCYVDGRWFATLEDHGGFLLLQSYNKKKLGALGLLLKFLDGPPIATSTSDAPVWLRQVDYRKVGFAIIEEHDNLKFEVWRRLVRKPWPRAIYDLARGL